MKSILFIIGSFDSGGVSKSLLNLLNAIDRKKYQVSVLTMNSQGVFQSLIPEDIRVITNPVIENLVSGPRGLLPLLKEKHFLSFFGSILRMCIIPINRAYAGWILSKLLPKMEESFDTVIDYNGQHQLYFMVDKIKSKKKITFFHSNYEQWPYYYITDKKYFSRVNIIFTISDICVEALKKTFPHVADKVFLMENITSFSNIKQMYKKSVDDMNEDCEFRFVSLGHVCEAKGSDLAIKAAALLKQKRINFKWYFVGIVSNKKHYLQKCKEYGVQDSIIYLGLKENPYPYIQKADIYIHLSAFEGKSIALEEAKMLNKPIVATNFPTVYDQFENGVNGSICEMNEVSVVSAITDLIFNESKCRSYIDYLKSNQHDNSNQINKFYSLIDK